MFNMKDNPLAAIEDILEAMGGVPQVEEMPNRSKKKTTVAEQNAQGFYSINQIAKMLNVPVIVLVFQMKWLGDLVTARCMRTVSDPTHPPYRSAEYELSVEEKEYSGPFYNAAAIALFSENTKGEDADAFNAKVAALAKEAIEATKDRKVPEFEDNI